MFRGKPWVWLLVLVGILLALSIGFLVIAVNNPPVPHEPADVTSPDDEFSEAQVADDVPGGQTT